MEYQYDLFVIGGGSGGLAAARRAAEHGANVALAEADQLGGTCVNRGCVPKKLMVYASHFPAHVKASAGYGWQIPPGEFSWIEMNTAVNREVQRLNGIFQDKVEKSGIKLYRDYARFVDSHTVEVGGQQVTAKRILIAVGGKPDKCDVPGIEHAVTSDAMFQLKEQPKRIVIIGGGYIGCEFACIMNGLGTEVTVAIRRDRVLNGFDSDLREEIHAAMEKQGIRILKNAQVVGLEKTDQGVTITIDDGDEHVIIADAVNLAATGRKPNLDGLGLENTQVTLEKGAVSVNEHSETSDPSVYAVGDCTGKIDLTPVAIQAGRILADRLYGGRQRQMSYDNIPSAVFTCPEAATVGLTEADAKDKLGEGDVEVFRTRFRPMYYTLPDIDKKMLMKLVVQRSTDKVIGAHIVGDSAAEMIQIMAIALKAGVTKSDINSTVGLHPTAAEELVTL